MSTEYTVAQDQNNDDGWFLNLDCYEDGAILYTKECEMSILDGTYAVTLTPDIIEAIKKLKKKLDKRAGV